MEDSLYSTLPTQISIRLVELHPGVYADEIRCSLHVVDLKDRPDYSAVSYAWGSAGAELPIWLNGMRILVRQNLHDALRRLRDATHSRVIWVDLLSINQDDLIEKSRQVAVMGTIFREATEVRIWLGEHADGSQRLFSPKFAEKLLANPLTQIQARLVRCCRPIPQTFFAGVLAFEIIYAVVISPEVFRERDPAFVCVWGIVTIISVAILTLFSLPGPCCYELLCISPEWRVFLQRPYWERTWVVQEICLGKKLVVCCDEDALDWGMLITPLAMPANAPSWKHRWDEARPATPKSYINFNLLELWCTRRNQVPFLEVIRASKPNTSAPPGSNIDTLIRDTSRTLCSDRRDRVYAILALVRWERGSHQRYIRPDYTRDFLDVVADVVRLPPTPSAYGPKIAQAVHRKNIEAGLLLTKKEKQRLSILLGPIEDTWVVELRWLDIRLFGREVVAQ